MRMFVCVALGAVSLAGCAANRAAPLAEVGYRPGALAVAAIERQDWAGAERLLNDRQRGASDDPARLINLGKVYWETGRQDQARALWRRAAAIQPLYVETVGGRSVSTAALAREALQTYGSGAPVVALRR
jgi:hypothetical protein